MAENTEQGFEHLATDESVIAPPEWLADKAIIGDMDAYKALYRRSIDDPEGFWAEMAREHLTWMIRLQDGAFRWFREPRLQVVRGRALSTSARTASIAISTRGGGTRPRSSGKATTARRARTPTSSCTTRSRASPTCCARRASNKGDRVALYMPMIPELPIAMLACARIGAIHSIVFGGFSSSALKGRIQDCGAKMLITADEGIRGGRKVPLKAAADEALFECPSVEACIVVKRGAGDVDMEPGRDTWWHQEITAPEVRKPFEAEPMNAEDPLFILYTSGSTGKPKGVLHTTAGYLLYSALTFKTVFDYRDEDVFWCTADIGWITGHSYIVYGPLAAGATTLMFEGIPTYPDPGRFWAIVEKYRVNTFYTAPTAIRALMRHGEGWPARYDLSSLRLLGTVGEPINPEVWLWYRKIIGRQELPIIDTYWQTETGGFLITPFPGAIPLKPGSATVPFFGIEPTVVTEDGSEAAENEGGYLVIENSWPGMMRGTWGDPDHTRMHEVYFERFPGRYFTGDGARKDSDGYFWLLGRVDDVINVSGHRLGTAEIESALVSHEAVSEAAVVGFPHPVKGEGIHAFVLLRDGQFPSEDLAKILRGHVRKIIGPIATPDHIQFARDLPKTRSGKIMRRILRKMAAGEKEMEAFGDISTLADPKVVKELLSGADEF